MSEVAYEWFGDPVLFTASLEQHCENAVPALFANVHWESGIVGPTAFGASNVLVTYRNRVSEYTLGGQLVQTVPVLGGDTVPNATEHLRDLVRDSSGRLHLYNGTFTPVLSSFVPVSGEWSHHAYSGWSTVNNGTYGGIASYGSAIFATDMATSGVGYNASGIVRFDASQGYAATRFADTGSYIDLAVGLDGKLYALRDDQKHVDVFDPPTFALQGTVTLAAAVRAIAVDGAGLIFGASWDDLLRGVIYRFDSTGVIQTSVNPGLGGMVDIDLRADGTIVAGAMDEFVVTDTSLASTTSFPLGDSSDETFVAFAKVPLDPDLIFGDGFDSGNTGAWTHTVGGV